MLRIKFPLPYLRSVKLGIYFQLICRTLFIDDMSVGPPMDDTFFYVRACRRPSEGALHIIRVTNPGS